MEIEMLMVKSLEKYDIEVNPGGRKCEGNVGSFLMVQNVGMQVSRKRCLR